MFTIWYHPAVVHEDIPKLAQSEQQLIQAAIEKKLMTFPEHFGKPLRRSLSGYRKLRVGDYRVVFCIEANSVKIFLIQHRSIVYTKGSKRLAT